MKRILIIGGCGYIGSALYRYLTNVVDLNVFRPVYHVDTVDLEWFGNYVNPDNILMDYKNLTAEFLDKFDVVILLAAHSSVPMATNSDVQSTLKNNVDNFVNLLTKLRQGHKFIYAGSASVYNGIPDDNVTEDYNLLAPSNCYDLTKQDIDRYAALFPHVEYYGLRFATVNGISDNLRTDVMINAMVEKALTVGEVTLFNPTIRRPILFLEDLCRAIHTIIDCPEDHRGVYNLASLNGTAGEFADAVASHIRVKLTEIDQHAVMGTSGITPYDFSVSPRRFCEIFNFQFTTNITEIIENVANYFDTGHPSKRLDAKHYA